MISGKETKVLDSNAEFYGVPNDILMENAGKGIAEIIKNRYKSKIEKILIICGLGNNGGDGFCVARHLLAAGIKPDVYLAGKTVDVKNEAKTNLDILIRLRHKVIEVNEGNLHLLRNVILKYRIIIKL